MVTSILYQKLLCNHSSYNRFTKTHHIGKKESIVADKFLIPFYDCIHLVVKLGVTFWHVEWVVVVSFQYAIGEILHEHLDVEVVW